MQSVKLPDLPLPTCAASAVMINDRIYVCGGLCDSVDLARQVQVYDVNHNVWSTLPHSPQYNSQGVAINSKLVLIGGYEAASKGVTNLVSTWTGQEWQQDLPPMPTKRFRPGMTTYHTFVVVAGGLAEDEQTLLSSVDILNITTRQWWTPANLHLPQPMCAMQCTISSAHLIDDSLYEPTPDIFIYNPDSDMWSKVGQLGVPRASCAVVSLSRTSFIVCGGCTDSSDPRNTLLSSVEVVHV